MVTWLKNARVRGGGKGGTESLRELTTGAKNASIFILFHSSLSRVHKLKNRNKSCHALKSTLPLLVRVKPFP